MADDKDIYAANYFFRDYVTEDIMVYCIGEIYLYHYKENLIGVRDSEEKTAHFIKVDSIPVGSNLYTPTAEQITEDHIKDAIDEVDKTGETLTMVDISDITSIAKELVAKEISRHFDKILLGDKG